MSELNRYFEERLADVKAYIDFLESLNHQISHNEIGHQQSLVNVTPQQQKILYSSVYLQLYNLIESTINYSMQLLTEKIIQNNTQPRLLREELLNEWVKMVAKTNIEMSDEKRLLKTRELCQYFIEERNIEGFNINIGGGGNLDNEEIYEIAKKVGLILDITQETSASINRPFKNDKGAIKCIKKFRNQLAHGNISFSECGEDLDIEKLRQLENITTIYLKEVVQSFSDYIENNQFLSLRVTELENISEA